MAPSISLRASIRWLPNAATEPTTTIVLTSSRNTFVDIRILKPDPASEHSDESHVGVDLLPFSRLDWAFAGTSSSTIVKDPETGNDVIHSKWAHWVSDRAEDVSDVVDEGDMFPQADGSVLEKGNMVNPATGKKGDYEEVWLDPAPVATTRIEADAVRLGNGKRVAAVLRLHDDANKARGVVVRVGQYCQGVIRVGAVFALERWEWSQEKGWRRSARMGDLWVPCGVVMEEGKVRVGGLVKYGDFEWVCEEWDEF